MKPILLYSLILCSQLPATEHLIYEENSFVNAKLHCPSSNGKWDLVYQGYRHKEQNSISVVHEILLVSR